MRTPEAYKESLRAMRPNVYKFGELIEDVTEHPATRRSVEGHAQIYEQAMLPEQEEVFTTLSSLTGERISRYLSIIRSAEDMLANSRMKRRMFNLTGTCTGARCVGWNALNTMWSVTHDIDKKFETDYHHRLREWILYAQANDLAVAGALTDPKGDRTKAPSEQEDPDVHLHIVGWEEGGITLRGAKVMIAGASAANEIFVLPGSKYKDSDADFAVACVVPRDMEGITIVEARHPNDGRDLEEGFDNPVDIGGITQGYILFDDVVVPAGRVFMAGEFGFTGRLIERFITPYRSAIGGCVAGQGDLMIGAAVLMARANGLSERTFRQKLVDMSINNETTYGMGIAAAVLGKVHSSGSWLCDPLLANINKVHVATLPYETKRITQEIGGGIAETGCMPSWKDLGSEEYGELLRKYLTADADGMRRAKAARMIEWLTLGSGVPGTMHGGGSPDGARMFVSSKTGLEEKVKLVERLMGEDEQDPGE